MNFESETKLHKATLLLIEQPRGEQNADQLGRALRRVCARGISRITS